MSEDQFQPFEMCTARIEVFRDTQALMLKKLDITIDRLTRVFKVSTLVRHGYWDRGLGHQC